MEKPEKIGISATIVIVLFALTFTINHEYFSSYVYDNLAYGLSNNNPNGLSNNNPNGLSLPIIISDIIIAVIIAFIVWYFTTKTERKNRQYIRNRIVDNYLQCWTISGALLNIPDKRNGINNLLDTILGFYKENVHLMELHSHLLDADEMENYRDQQDVVESLFIEPLRVDSHNNKLLNELTNFFRNTMVDYIVKYKVKKYYEYK